MFSDERYRHVSSTILTVPPELIYIMQGLSSVAEVINTEHPVCRFRIVHLY